jgi:tetratricopeptide (TPR) repeat protein
MDQPRLALDAYQRALAIFIDVLGTANRETALALKATANALAGLGQYDESLAHWGRARESWLAVEGADSLHVAEVTSQMAEYEAQRGDVERAISLQREAIAILTKRHGADAPETLSARIGLARQFRSREQIAAARSEIEDVIAHCEKASENAEPVRAFAKVELARILASIGDHEMAGEQLREAVDQLLKNPGERDARVASAMIDYAQFLTRQRDLVAAERHLKRAVVNLSESKSTKET